MEPEKIYYLWCFALFISTIILMGFLRQAFTRTWWLLLTTMTAYMPYLILKIRPEAVKVVPETIGISDISPRLFESIIYIRFARAYLEIKRQDGIDKRI